MANDELTSEQVGNAGLDLLLNLFEQIPNEYRDLKDSNATMKEKQVKNLLLEARTMAVQSNQIVLASSGVVEDVEYPPVTDYEELTENPQLIVELYDWGVKYGSEDKIKEVKNSNVGTIVNKIKRGKLR